MREDGRYGILVVKVRLAELRDEQYSTENGPTSRAHWSLRTAGHTNGSPMSPTPLLIADGIVADGVLIDADAPLGVVWVPLQSGLTVLYGRNGAGKSKLLQAITGAFRGVAIDGGVVSLHLSLVEYGGTWNPHLLHQLARWLEARTRLSRLGTTEDGSGNLGDVAQASEISEPDGSDHEEWVKRTVKQIKEWLPLCLPHQMGMLDGHCHTPRLALVAVGTSAKPAWEIHMSVVPTDNAEFFQQHISTHSAEVFEITDQTTSESMERRFWPRSLRTLLDVMADPGASVPVHVAQLLDPDGRHTIDAANVLNCRDAAEHFDISRRTLEGIKQAAAADGEFDLIDFASNNEFEASESVAEYLTALGQRATWLLKRLSGDDMGHLEPQLLHPNQWLVGRTVEWFGVDSYGTELPVSSLGAGSQRWATLAISMALRSSKSANPAIFLVDEPERALHSAAQLQTANAMTSVMLHDDGYDHVVTAGIVASHSPAFLSNPDANLVHVSRGTKGNVRLDGIDVTAGVEGLVAQLGLTHTDALLTVRTFVYVEGEHDLAVLGAVFDNAFRERHAVLHVMRGAANIAAHVNAEHILAYSDAKIRVVLDRIGALTADEWRQAVNAFRDNEPTKARRLLDALPKQGRGREAEWLAAAGVAALDRGQLDRIELVGLAKPDIIQYLPVKSLVPGADSWEDLVGEWRASPNRPDFKSWLRDHKGAQFTSKKLGEIANRLDPADLGDLAKVVEGL